MTWYAQIRSAQTCVIAANLPTQTTNAITQTCTARLLIPGQSSVGWSPDIHSRDDERKSSTLFVVLDLGREVCMFTQTHTFSTTH